MDITILPIPSHYDPSAVDDVWRVPYQDRVSQAHSWAKLHDIRPIIEDERRVGLLLIDVENTFCIPGFELFVNGSVANNCNLIPWMYQHCGLIDTIFASQDAHPLFHIGHESFWTDLVGDHPAVGTEISFEDISSGRWGPDPNLAVPMIAPSPGTVWPYHAMGIGQAMVSSVEEACIWQQAARISPMVTWRKGEDFFFEEYSVLGGNNEVRCQQLADLDVLVVAGQAKSHCVRWTLQDLVDYEVERGMTERVSRIYVLQDCTSSVVIPGIADFTADADAAFAEFQEFGVNLVETTTSMGEWPGMEERLG
jgi:nicotinamidase-related amidase